MATSLPVLIVSSQALTRDRIAAVVRNSGLLPVFSPTLADARAILQQSRPAIIFCADDLPDSELRHALAALKADTGVPIIAVSHLAEWTCCLEAFSAGAFDYIACPPNPRETERILRLALDFHHRSYTRHTAA
jgi:two-component system response regulator MtrA